MDSDGCSTFLSTEQFTARGIPATTGRVPGGGAPHLRRIGSRLPLAAHLREVVPAAGAALVETCAVAVAVVTCVTEGLPGGVRALNAYALRISPKTWDIHQSECPSMSKGARLQLREIS